MEAEVKETLNNAKARLATLTLNSQMEQISVNLLLGRERDGLHMRTRVKADT